MPDNFHSQFCALRHGGGVCTCDYFKQPTSQEKTIAQLRTDLDAAKARLKKIYDQCAAESGHDMTRDEWRRHNRQIMEYARAALKEQP